MQLKMWSYDLAREQAPTLDHLRQIAKLTLESGFDALGLYLEHRFAYPSAPWAAGEGALTAEMVKVLEKEFPALKFIPMINLLGHMEGFLYTETGKQFKEELFKGLQACPCNPEFKRFCHDLLADTLSLFSSEIVHIGGDETQQLGRCSKCEEFVKHGGKSGLYAQHFGPLAEQVVAAGRRPAIWGDMFAEHPEALSAFPKETIVFDWRYHSGISESARLFVEHGFEVVGCPAIQTYNAAWCHVEQSKANVAMVASDVKEMGLHGVCLTTWECALFGAYDTIFPLIQSAGAYLSDGEQMQVEPNRASWERLMSDELQKLGGLFCHSRIRSSLKVRLMLNANPFLAWLHHGEELSGPSGQRALEICEEALRVAPGEAERGVSLFVRSAIEFVRLAEEARREYAALRPEAAISKLAPARTLFDTLERVARRTNARIGGSLADIERCKVGRMSVERAISRIREYGDGSLGYLPAFEHITHPKFVPHDQGAWWLINQWANQ